MEHSRPLRFIPNVITLISLFCGCLGVVWALTGEIQWAVYLIWVCAVLDLLDGLIARAINASSELGKQLDSLADLVSFGILPASIIFAISSGYLSNPWPYCAYLITIFSALRLARFNLDTEQTTDFVGFPTPANAILISSFPTIIDQNFRIIRLGLENPLIWLLIIGILSYLLVSNIRLMGFKFQNLNWIENQYRYLFMGISVLLGLIMGIISIPLIMALYLSFSLLWRLKS